MLSCISIVIVSGCPGNTLRGSAWAPINSGVSDAPNNPASQPRNEALAAPAKTNTNRTPITTPLFMTRIPLILYINVASSEQPLP